MPLNQSETGGQIKKLLYIEKFQTDQENPQNMDQP